MGRVFMPMPEETEAQSRVHATIPTELYRRFRAKFPHQGAIQYAIRLMFEALPEITDRDEAYRAIFIEEMMAMYANDRANWETKNRLPIVNSKHTLPLDVPLSTMTPDEEDEALNDF